MPGPDVPKSKVVILPCVAITKERATEKPTFCITNAIQVMHTETRFRDSILNDFDSPLPMMRSCVTGKEALPGRCDVCMPNV
jgi:hypothetical protein